MEERQTRDLLFEAEKGAASSSSDKRGPGMVV